MAADLQASAHEAGTQKLVLGTGLRLAIGYTPSPALSGGRRRPRNCGLNVGRFGASQGPASKSHSPAPPDAVSGRIQERRFQAGLAVTRSPASRYRPGRPGACGALILKRVAGAQVEEVVTPPDLGSWRAQPHAFDRRGLCSR